MHTRKLGGTMYVTIFSCKFQRFSTRRKYKATLLLTSDEVVLIQT